MKIYTKLELLKATKVTPGVAAKIAENNDEVLAYTEDMSGTMDFATAKALAPILDRTDLCDMSTAGGRDGMLVTAAVSAALSGEGKSALIGNSMEKGTISVTVDGKDYAVLLGKSIGDIYDGSAAAAPAKPSAPAQQQKKKADAPVKSEPKQNTDMPVAGHGAVDEIQVDADILEPFLSYIPDNCGIDGLSREDFGKALYKALNESVSDADAVTRLETYVGADAGNVMKLIKERGLYDELRDLAQL